MEPNCRGAAGHGPGRIIIADMPRRLAPALAAASLLLLARCAGCGEEERCPSGLADCGGVCVDLLGDEANCGACGRVCGAGQT